MEPEDELTADRKLYTAMIEDHLATAEKAALLLVSSLERAEFYMDELKAQEGWRWKRSGNPHAFGNIPLFEEHRLAIVPKPKKRKR